MATDAYLAFLGLGLAMVIVDGQILYHSGKRYLADADSSAESSKSMAKLITVLFHLVMFGILALLSVLDFGFGAGGVRAVVGNLGILLILVGLGHAVMMAVLAQVRDSRVAEEGMAVNEQARMTNSQLQRGPVVAPVPGQPGRDPRRSPTIEDQSL
ncbi:hypothetical protein [Prauserella muralis]|uniref:Uncharacterized protein n=1 Tax=Prauserella muralis TaxID=588067 RepID=A0A2V4B9A7_9PSEU|nr:hypothetical protein [Prauserella muralis]PXY31944.1 hypothetical protein BAY60_06355 [Prauserella muralis]TWE13631.1 hypothetical protein FHX69_5755 [Prauserella muralis]